MSHIRIPRSWELAEAQATDESAYLDRRQVLRGLGLGTLGMSLNLSIAGCVESAPSAGDNGAGGKLAPAVGNRFDDVFPADRNKAFKLEGGRRLTPEDIASGYNNFYEFTTDKERVWELAQGYKVDPWKVEVGGLVQQPRTLDLDDFFTRFPLEERLYRFRCVERWAMQVPWTGFPLHRLIDYLEPLSSAKYVAFHTFLDRSLPGVGNGPWYPWPYTEGLRLDEARHELAFVAVGIYGHGLPMQHGAPWRVIVPWKYGYKSPKSVMRIEFTAEQPSTFWNDFQPSEYGFYSNIDPGKPHPRWSQALETDIGTGHRRDTRLYNGYDEVASLYDGSEA